jgi:hypothetical protein
MKTFKNYIWMAIGTALVIAVFSGLTAGPALAQLVRAALVKNIDERGRNPYEEQVGCTDAAFVNQCRVEAAAVPTGKRLVIEHVSMRLYLQGTQPFGPATLFGNEFDVLGIHFQREQFISPKLDFANSIQALYSANERVLTYYDAGQKPTILIPLIGSGNGQFVDVTLSGYYVDLTL